MNMNRRQMLIGSSALLASSYIAPALAQEPRLRMLFWGNQVRGDRTYKVIELFGEKTGIPMTAEFLAFGDYWPKLATQTAGGGAPDVVQMDGAGRYITEYANRGGIAPLDAFVGNELDFSDFDQDQLDAGKVNGKLYAVSLGSNAFGMIVNTEVFAAANVDIPGPNTTLDDLYDIGEAFKSAGISQTVTDDRSGSWAGLENWLRQQGKALYTADGALGFDEADMTGWLSLWKGYRDAGICVAADVQAMADGPATSPLITGQSASMAEFSNLLLAHQVLTTSPLILTNFPRIALDAPGGYYRRPSMFFSISENSAHKAEAARFINFFVNDVEANKILCAERGIPASAHVREGIADTLDETTKAAVAYVGGLGPLLSPPPPQSPSGGGEINEALLSAASQEVAFDTRSPEDAATGFIAAAKEALQRAR
ncbi:ABC transporter substrate-binding protein [Martelella endophytica]|uniref:ABC transporter substrate-binding protein n=1 Tax=Martelella endophytica TaxID=1486262 RepID=UPI0005F2555B|nr:extracellular solute-binding protein [Martelella endophytica]